MKRGLVVLLTFLVINLYWTGDRSSKSTYASSSSEGSGELSNLLGRSRVLRGKVPFTQILNHAPGFTVFKNIYYQRGRYILVTDAPHEFPTDTTRLIFKGGDPLLPQDANLLEMVEVRQPPIMINMPDYLDHYITPEAAIRRFNPAEVEVIPGISVSDGSKRVV